MTSGLAPDAVAPIGTRNAEMPEKDCSLCITCTYSNVCEEMTKNLEAYECDAYTPEEEK